MIFCLCSFVLYKCKYEYSYYNGNNYHINLFVCQLRGKATVAGMKSCADSYIFFCDIIIYSLNFVNETLLKFEPQADEKL